MKIFTKFILIAIFVQIPNLAPAPIFGWYGGLEFAIYQADVIVVGEITASYYDALAHNGYPNSFMWYEDYDVRVIESIKGNLEANQTYKVGIRPLPLDLKIGRRFTGVQMGSCNLLFMTFKLPFHPYVPSGYPAVAWTNNAQGSLYPINPGIKPFLGPKKKKPLAEERITEIVNKSLELNTDPVAKLEEKRMRDAFLRTDDNDTTRRKQFVGPHRPRNSPWMLNGIDSGWNY